MLNNFSRLRARRGYDEGGTIAGLPFAAPPNTQQMQLTPQQLRSWSEMIENLEVPGEVGPAEQARGVGNFPFRNFGEAIGVPRMSNDELRQRVNQHYGDNPRGMTEANNIYDYMQQDPTNSDRIWEWLDPQAMPMTAEQPTPEPQPEPTPAPTPTPIPRQEYTYPTETLPQAEPPPPPGFLTQSQGLRNFTSPYRNFSPIPPLGQMGQMGQNQPRARGGHVRAKMGYAEGGGDIMNAMSHQGNLQPGTFLPVSEVGMVPGWGSDNAGYRYADVNSRSGPGLYHMPEGMEQVWPDTLSEHQESELGWTPISNKKWQLAARDSPQATPDTPAPTPTPDPEPEQPRQEYTYPTETLPQAEPPAPPSFMNRGMRFPSIRPISGQTFIPPMDQEQRRKGGPVSRNNINRARLRAVVSAKRGDFNG